MANLGSVKIIKRPPPASVQFKLIQDQIARELKSVGQAHVDERNKVVSDFETDIEFGYRVSVTQKQITLSIVVENSEQVVSEDFTVGDLWKSLDKTGTRGPYQIPKQVVEGKRLAFRRDYQPHTRPIGRSGGPGVATGAFVRPIQVTHPGIKPRHFSRVINKKLDKRFTKAIDRGVRLGGRKRR